MLVYRISQTKYANSLIAPGIAARWNSAGQRIIYTGGSLALSCLEIVAHKSGASLQSGDFSVAIIELDQNIKIEEIIVESLIGLDEKWFQVINYPVTQALGDEWLKSGSSAILKVPSAIIDLEFNYLLNPNHQDFSKVKIVQVNKFTFDPRLKANP
ncbi:RES domain-containing protein [Pedobacter sp. HMF7647]|uniref:RES domain-containing protein n=1 Tax=Hufsiella arboris TaxID=2695275 RepID=A0A7K1YAQ4_9SPHI|nr:RES family NAD+ phosphorylase [Hufsiella arboris]MXV51665.1 RES domain-containing protein [Hufsiella arboris]